MRRAQEFAERGHTKLTMILLDGEKAFDKLYQDKIFEAMYRMGIPTKLINVTKALYANPLFKVNMFGVDSDWKKQETGIRQGCPLSPYLFIIVMAVLMHDLHEEDHLGMIRHRQANCNFDELLYADDTAILSTDTAAIAVWSFSQSISMSKRSHAGMPDSA